MKTTISATTEKQEEAMIETSTNNKKQHKDKAIAELRESIHTALSYYSNVHRGSGHFSMVSTHLYEQAREIVLDFLQLDKNAYELIFCSPRRADILTNILNKQDFEIASNQQIGLPIGVRAVAIRKKALPRGNPFQAGGGTTRLIGQEWVMWAKAPDKFEAGTPSVINVVAFAKALQLGEKYGSSIFKNIWENEQNVEEILFNDEFNEISGKELLDKLKQSWVGRDVLIPTTEGESNYINLDNSASTPTFDAIWKVFSTTLIQTENTQQKLIEETKSICANTLGAPQEEYDIVFTSNTTESVNLAAENFNLNNKIDTEPIVLNTFLEHSSNDLPWRMFPNYSLERFPVDNNGFVNITELEKRLIAYNEDLQFGKKRIQLVAINGASNVLGICNNLVEIGRVVKKHDAQLLVDAAQLIAHRKIDMQASGIDYLVFSAHKVYAPFGAGVLVARKGLLNFDKEELAQIQLAGEENAAGIAAFGKSLSLLQRVGMDTIADEEKTLTKYTLKKLSQIQDLKIHGLKDVGSPEFGQKLGVIPFDLKNKMSRVISNKLAEQGGIGVRWGCHCAHLIIKQMLGIGPFLEKIQRTVLTLFPKLQLQGVIRASFGLQNSTNDVDKFVKTLEDITNKSKQNGNNEISRKKIQEKMDDFVKEIATKVYS